jgi:hypothetical protein
MIIAAMFVSGGVIFVGGRPLFFFGGAGTGG